MMNEKVSIYMPTHNRSEMARKAIDSVLSQTYLNIELLIVDDASTDGTAEMLRLYSTDPRVKVFRNSKPSGACHARNVAIDNASGLYITGLDDDDEFLPDHIDVLKKSFSDDYSFVASSLVEDRGNDRIVRRSNCGLISIDDLLHYNKVGNQVFTKLSRIKAVGGFDESLPAFQDYDLWVRLCNEFGPAVKLTSATYVLNTGHELGRITENNKRRLKAFDIFFEKHKALMSKKHLNSMFLLKKGLMGLPYSIREFFSLTNRGNWKASVSYFLNKNLFSLKKIVDRVRHRT